MINEKELLALLGWLKRVKQCPPNIPYTMPMDDRPDVLVYTSGMLLCVPRTAKLLSKYPYTDKTSVVSFARHLWQSLEESATLAPLMLTEHIVGKDAMQLRELITQDKQSTWLDNAILALYSVLADCHFAAISYHHASINLAPVRLARGGNTLAYLMPMEHRA